MSYLENYLERITNSGKPFLSEAIQKTVDDIVPEYIANFSFMEHVVALLVGDVQSGKTSHMFGLMCAAADEGFMNLILLTTDNVLLQQQTLQRAERDLSDFCICGESDYLKFSQNNKEKPAVIVLKKNSRVLKHWKKHLESTKFYVGNHLFIVDDEGDAASLNTKVNKNEQSSINKVLDAIKKTVSSSIYLEVTGTPQAILLQTAKSGWKPYFMYYFHPGKGYLGGNFFFSDKDILNNKEGHNTENSVVKESKPAGHIILTDADESSDILHDEDFPENCLRRALISHLIASAHIMLSGGHVCNFLIHPSVKVSAHEKFAEKIGEYINEVLYYHDDDEAKDTFKEAYVDLMQTKPDIKPFNEIYDFVIEQLKNDTIKVLVMNSVSPFEDSTQYESGINIIVGGNSLGRGVTFPQLQTIYYCRMAKRPQADTMWQHARMFGYDRDPGLIRVYMPSMLYKLFSEINKTNNSIIKQIEHRKNGENIELYYPAYLKPTRKDVIDQKLIAMYSGGVNYFPFDPSNTSIEDIDKLLSPFDDGIYSLNLKAICKILDFIDTEADDWDAEAFAGFVNALSVKNPATQGKLIVRRNRDISKGTGTLLSPTDRKIGGDYPNEVVLTMYKVTGEKGWNGQKLWIPNIKLPNDGIYYTGDK